MKAKTLVTGALLAFVAASVAALVFKGTRGKPAATVADRPVSTGVVAYYFHGNVRCPTCRKIESLSREAIETGFGDALRDGQLQWRTVNVEEPGNEHFVKDYALTTRSLVLVDSRGQWKNLDQVWQLIGNPPAFVQYVQDELRTFLGAS